MDTDSKCPRCQSEDAVPGVFAEDGTPSFRVAGGQLPFGSNLPRVEPLGSFWACPECGLLWAELPLAELRRLLARHGRPGRPPRPDSSIS
jgi:hypothetical protein